MRFTDISARVSGSLSGYAGMTVRFTNAEIVSALNQAQQYVAADLMQYVMRIAQTSTEEGIATALRMMQFGYWDWLDDVSTLATPIDSAVDPDFLSVLESAPDMLVDGSQEPVLPYYAHDALITRAVIVLSGKFGDQKESFKIRRTLDAQYAQEITHAKRTANLRMENRPIRVEDANDPDRWIRQEW